MRLFLAVVSLSAAIFAANPVGTLTSSENFNLSGTEISVSGVPSWPVLAGDQIQTRAAAAMLRLADGSRVIINSNSRVALEPAGLATRIKLIHGSLRYNLKPGSAFEIIANKLSSRVSAYSNGNLSVDGSQAVITAAATPGTNDFVPAPVFRPGPLNLPTANQLANSTAPAGLTSPSPGAPLPWLSSRP